MPTAPTVTGTSPSGRSAATSAPWSRESGRRRVDPAALAELRAPCCATRSCSFATSTHRRRPARLRHAARDPHQAAPDGRRGRRGDPADRLRQARPTAGTPMSRSSTGSRRSACCVPSRCRRTAGRRSGRTPSAPTSGSPGAQGAGRTTSARSTPTSTTTPRDRPQIGGIDVKEQELPGRVPAPGVRDRAPGRARPPGDRRAVAAARALRPVVRRASARDFSRSVRRCFSGT